VADGLTPVSGGGTPESDLLRLEDELGRLARELTPRDMHLEAPPIDLWSRIEAEIAAEPAAEAAPDKPSAPRALREVGGARLRTSRIGAPRGLDALSGTSVPSRPPELRSRSGMYGIPAALAVAAALAVVLATGAALIVRTTNADVTVAQAAIANDGLPVPISGSGTAVLKQHGDDQFLELDLPDLEPGDPNSIYEVWMIDTDVVGMISLGNLTSTGGETTRIDLPDTIDHTAFPVIDISVEPLDGDPTHSGQSVLRGVLTDVEDA